MTPTSARSSRSASRSISSGRRARSAARNPASASTTRRYGARSASKAEARDVTDGTNGAGPLDGLTLIDFGQYLAGPFGPMILADLGMDVIKIEPATGDGMRMAGKPFFGCQRGKR